MTSQNHKAMSAAAAHVTSKITENVQAVLSHLPGAQACWVLQDVSDTIEPRSMVVAQNGRVTVFSLSRGLDYRQPALTLLESATRARKIF